MFILMFVLVFMFVLVLRFLSLVVSVVVLLIIISSASVPGAIAHTRARGAKTTPRGRRESRQRE
jgi:hypothetical protein